MQARLVPHPDTPSMFIDEIAVWIERDGDSRLWARFEVRGGVSKIVWPATGLGGRADGLWRTTCFEAFLQGEDAYWEFNFSPAGQWASYRFDGYRSGGREAVEVASPSRLVLEDAYAEIEATFERPAGGSRLGLSAVIEGIDGTKSYWALAHPSDKPDFHHPDSFLLDIP